MQEEQIKHKAHGFVAKTSWWDNIKHFSFHSFFGHFPHARLLTLIGVLLIIIVLPITVLFLGKTTQTQNHASGLTCSQIKGALCLSLQFCKTNYQHCVAGYSCASGTVCGYDDNACHYNGGSCGVNSNCCSGYCSQGTCSNPPPPPVYTCKPTSGSWPACRGTGLCTSANGLAPANNGKTCPSGQICCMPAPKPKPSPTTVPCNVNNCAGPSYGNSTCPNANFYPGPSSCTYGGKNGVCCRVAPIKPTPTLAPLPDQNAKRCGTNTNQGICYYYSETFQGVISCNPNSYTANAIYACDTSGFQNLPSCGTVVQRTTGKSGSQNLSSYDSQCKGISTGGGTGMNVIHAECCSVVTATTPPPPSATCTSKVGACEKYQCGAGEKVAKSSSGSTYSCAQGPEFVCCAKAPVSSPPKYYCSPNNSSDPTGTSIKGDDGSVTNCNTGTYCRNGATYSTMKGWTDAKTHLCIRTPDVCSSKYHGLCAPSCQSGDINVTDAAAVKDCADNSKGNPLCCAPKSSGGGGGGGSCSNGKSTSFATEMKLPGIGSGTFENHSPKHTTRQTTVTVKDKGGKTVWTQSAFSTKLSFTSAKKLRVGTIGLGTGLVCSNTYTVYVKVPGYVTMKKQITYGNTSQTLQVSESEIIPGDLVSEGTNNVVTPDGKLAGDDKVTLADYNVVRTCHNADPNTTLSFKNGTQTLNLKCGDLMNLFDYPDGGTKGDEWAFNYNLWLRGYLKYQGL